MSYKERVLTEIFKDEELDVFGVFKRRRLKEQNKISLSLLKIEKEKARKHNIYFYGILSKKLVEIYGPDGAIPYLEKLFKKDLVEKENGNGGKDENNTLS